MIAKDLEGYANQYWCDTYRKSVKDISCSDKEKSLHPLVDSDFEMFDFDEIVKSLFNRENEVCCSADALYIGADILHPTKRNRRQPCVYLIEFKPWHKNEDGESEYQKAIKKAIDADLRLKAVESYVILVDKFCPLCESLESPIRLVHWIVTNQPPMEDGIDAQKEQSKQEQKKFNRLRAKIKIEGKESRYLYDDIRVMGATQFESYLKLFTRFK